MKSFAVQLKKRREELGWTQTFTAQQIGVSLGTYNKWEKSAVPPKRKYLTVICIGMSVSEEYFH